MKKLTSRINTKILKLIGIIVAIELCVGIASTIITYPTENHKAVSREMSSLQLNTDQGMSTDPQNRYNQLFSSPTGQYIEKAGIITGAIQILTSIAMMAVLYTQIRKRRLSGDPVSSTAISYVLVVLVVAPLGTLINDLYIGQTTMQFLPFLASLLGGSIFTFLIAYLVATILHGRYNRKHSFVVE